MRNKHFITITCLLLATLLLAPLAALHRAYDFPMIGRLEQ